MLISFLVNNWSNQPKNSWKMKQEKKSKNWIFLILLHCRKIFSSISFSSLLNTHGLVLKDAGTEKKATTRNKTLRPSLVTEKKWNLKPLSCEVEIFNVSRSLFFSPKNPHLLSKCWRRAFKIKLRKCAKNIEGSKL